MKTSTIVWIVVLIIILLGGWYIWMQASVPAPVGPTANAGLNGSPNQGNLGQPNNGTPQTPSAGPSPTNPPDSAPSSGPSPSGDGTGVSQNLILGITPGSGDVTNFLSAYNGMTVYTYMPDSTPPGKSNCTGGCASVWPPYTVQSASDIHVSAATTGTVATITRADGTLQITYNGKPLYFYSGDKKPGDANGEGIGGVWYVAKP